MSLKKDLYNDIKAAVLSIESVKTFRLWNNQFDSEKKEDAFEYDAVFLEYENIDYLPTTQGSQKGDVLITLHVGIASLKTEEPRIFDLLDEILIKLTDLKLGLTRVREKQDVDHDGVQAWDQSYRTELLDDTANIPTRRTFKQINELEVDGQLSIKEESKTGVRSASNTNE